MIYDIFAQCYCNFLLFIAPSYCTLPFFLLHNTIVPCTFLLHHAIVSCICYCTMLLYPALFFIASRYCTLQIYIAPQYCTMHLFIAHSFCTLHFFIAQMLLCLPLFFIAPCYCCLPFYVLLVRLNIKMVCSSIMCSTDNHVEVKHSLSFNMSIIVLRLVVQQYYVKQSKYFTFGYFFFFKLLGKNIGSKTYLKFVLPSGVQPEIIM